MKKWFFITSFIALGLIASYHGLRPDTLFHNDKTSSDSAMSFYLHNVELHSFNEQGDLIQVLTAANTSQRADQNEIILDTLQLDIGLAENRWHISSLSGTTDSLLQKITLTNSVRLIRVDGTAEIFTELLALDADSETAYTDAPIKILFNGSETNATGLHIDLQQETIHLKNNVKTYYDPKNNQPVSHRSNS